MKFSNSLSNTTKTLGLLCYILASSSCALKDQDAPIPAEKAVTKVSEDLGFQLLPKAIKNIGVITKPIETPNGNLGVHTLPKSALIHSLDQLAVYRLRDNWFKLIQIILISEQVDRITIRSSEIQTGDQIVFQGAALLRVADMEAFGGEE